MWPSPSTILVATRIAIDRHLPLFSYAHHTLKGPTAAASECFAALGTIGASTRGEITGRVYRVESGTHPAARQHARHAIQSNRLQASFVEEHCASVSRD